MTDNEAGDEIVSPRRRSPLRRLGCTIIVIIWFVLLLTPCLGIVLATQGDLVIPQGNAPGHEIRIWLITEADSRGVGISSAVVHQRESDALCVETNTRFILWAGNADPLTSCVCYSRSNAEAAWSTVSVEDQACESDG